MLALLLSEDIHANPSPKGSTKTKEITVKDKSIYPCAYCESGVTWGQAGACCEHCEMWFHKTCLSLNTSSFETYMIQMHPGYVTDVIHKFRIIPISII